MAPCFEAAGCVVGSAEPAFGVEEWFERQSVGPGATVYIAR